MAVHHLLVVSLSFVLHSSYTKHTAKPEDSSRPEEAACLPSAQTIVENSFTHPQFSLQTSKSDESSWKKQERKPSNENEVKDHLLV